MGLDPKLETGTFEHRFTPAPEALEEAQLLLTHWMRSNGLDRHERGDSVAIASELCAAVSDSVEEQITLRAALAEDRVVIEVEDRGHGFRWQDDDDAAGTGRTAAVAGLCRVTGLAAEVSVESAPSGTVIRSTRRLNVG
jgi:anti-sigma regulatory factor (Ser/Thr protein kinase)